MLHQLVYVSRPAPSLTLTDVSAIVAAATDRNEELGMTGFLAFRPGWFLQVIEGSRDNISRLFCRIARDNRHDQVELISVAPIERRMFGQWGMGLAVFAGEQAPIVRRFLAPADADARRLTREDALSLLSELAYERATRPGVSAFAP
jgi:hypothetical protein